MNCCFPCWAYLNHYNWIYHSTEIFDQNSMSILGSTSRLLSCSFQSSGKAEMNKSCQHNRQVMQVEEAKHWRSALAYIWYYKVEVARVWLQIWHWASCHHCFRFRLFSSARKLRHGSVGKQNRSAYLINDSLGSCKHNIDFAKEASSKGFVSQRWCCCQSLAGLICHQLFCQVPKSTIVHVHHLKAFCIIPRQSFFCQNCCSPLI